MVLPPALSVRQVMLCDPCRVPPQQPIHDVLQLMRQRRIGSVLVVEDQDRLVGIFTSHDLLKFVAEATSGGREDPIARWMTRSPITIGPEVGWEEALQLMERQNIRHLPVCEHGRLIGLVSARELIRSRALHLNHLIESRTAQLRQANAELLSREAEMRHYFRVAGRLQQRLVLPHAPPHWPGLSWGIHFAPLDNLGGDFYDFAQPDDDHLGILIADASGHSLPASMVAIMARFAFSEVAHTTVRPGEVLSAMNQRLQGLTDERFVTAFYGVIDRRNYRLTYANAGHPFPYRYEAKTGRCHAISSRGLLLGIMPEERYRERELDLEPGDRLVLFTDGLVDTLNERGDAFGPEFLLQAICRHGQETADKMARRLFGDLTNFRGTRSLADDVTIVVAGMDTLSIMGLA